MVYIKFYFLTITECNISISLETKCRGMAVLRKTTLWCPVVSCSPNGTYLQFFIRFYQARNKLGTPGVAKSFLKSAQIFQTMFNTFFQGGGEDPPGYGPGFYIPRRRLTWTFCYEETIGNSGLCPDRPSSWRWRTNPVKTLTAQAFLVCMISKS